MDACWIWSELHLYLTRLFLDSNTSPKIMPSVWIFNTHKCNKNTNSKSMIYICLTKHSRDMIWMREMGKSQWKCPEVGDHSYLSLLRGGQGGLVECSGDKRLTSLWSCHRYTSNITISQSLIDNPSFCTFSKCAAIQTEIKFQMSLTESFSRWHCCIIQGNITGTQGLNAGW